MNFYPAVLIPLSIFTPLFYLNWNRIDKIVDESLFARFLLFGLLLGIIYSVLFLYSFFTIYRYEDLMLFSLLLFLPMLSAGELLSMVTGKYRGRKDLIQLSSSLGGAFSLPVTFGIAIVTTTSPPNYFFVAMVALLAFLTNLMSGVLLATGASRNRVLLYFNFAFLVQMLFSSSIFIEYLYGSYAIITILPEIAIAILLYMKFFHERLGKI
jgi:peptidoglycan/LPS O-acetylase OafA/YrhL